MNNKELNIALGKLFNGIELDTHKVELGYLQDVAKNADNAIKKYKDSADIVKAWQDVKKVLLNANKDIMYVRKNRKAYIIGIEGEIQDLEADIKYITNKFKEIGQDSSKVKEVQEAKRAVYQLNNFLKDLKRIDDFDGLKL